MMRSDARERFCIMFPGLFRLLSENLLSINRLPREVRRMKTRAREKPLLASNLMLEPRLIPSVSYMIPAFNHASFVKETLDSIKADNYPDKEILLIDDGSTDETFEIARAWALENPELTIHVSKQRNLGVTSTLNRLIERSQGKYLRLCASDDLIVAGSTEILVQSLEQNPYIQATFGDCYVIDSSGKDVASSAIALKGESSRAYELNLATAIIRHWAVCGPAILIRKEYFLREGMYDESLAIEDWYLYLRLASKNQIHFINKPVAYYRLHDSNTSRTKEVQIRVNNLSSQFKAAQLNMGKFSRPHNLLLLARANLLKAKMDFLRNLYFVCAFHLLVFAILDFWGRFELKFSQITAPPAFERKLDL